MEWVDADQPNPRNGRAQLSAGKILLTVFWDARGIILTDYLKHGRTINGPYYALLLERVRAVLRTKRRGTLTVGFLLLQDNACAHLRSCCDCSSQKQASTTTAPTLQSSSPAITIFFPN